MKLISHPIFLKHDLDGHPECAERIKKALKTFKYEKAKNGETYLQLVHSTDYINKIKKASKEAGEGVIIVGSSDTYADKHTYEAACYAVGASIQAAEYAKKKKNAFAIVRPPGHHAHPDWTNGFCIFNNMAIAAIHLASKKSRVLIIDVDMHRGDGTGDCVDRFNADLDGRIFYFSINQSGAFPGASIDEGNILNIYVGQDTGEDEYIEAMSVHVEVLINKFKPTVIGISAGFDSFARDTASFHDSLGCSLNNTGKMIKALRHAIKGIPYFVILEGGYDPDSVVEGIAAFTDKIVKLPKLNGIRHAEKKEAEIIIPMINLPKEKHIKKENPPKIKRMKLFRQPKTTKSGRKKTTKSGTKKRLSVKSRLKAGKKKTTKTRK